MIEESRARALLAPLIPFLDTLDAEFVPYLLTRSTALAMHGSELAATETTNRVFHIELPLAARELMTVIIERSAVQMRFFFRDYLVDAVHVGGPQDGPVVQCRYPIRFARSVAGATEIEIDGRTYATQSPRDVAGDYSARSDSWSREMFAEACRLQAPPPVAIEL